MPDPVSLLLFLAACLGHLILFIYGHNLLYGFVSRPLLSDLARGLHGVAVFGAAAAYWYFWGLDGRALLNAETAATGWGLPLAYVVLCWLTTFVFFPAVTVYRLTR